MAENSNLKLQQIENTAQNLFKRYGFRRVSVEEICRESGVSKMTFYKHFKNKTELIKHLLDKMFSENLKIYREIMAQDLPFSVKAEQTIQMKLEKTDGISKEYMHEILHNSNPEIAQTYARIAQNMLKELMNDYIHAQENGEVRKDIKPEFMLYFLNHLIEMSEDERLLALYDSPQDMSVELTKFFFYGILHRDRDSFHEK